MRRFCFSISSYELFPERRQENPANSSYQLFLQSYSCGVGVRVTPTKARNFRYLSGPYFRLTKPATRRFPGLPVHVSLAPVLVCVFGSCHCLPETVTLFLVSLGDRSSPLSLLVSCLSKSVLGSAEQCSFHISNPLPTGFPAWPKPNCVHHVQ